MRRHSLRRLVRQPLRTLASVAGVALAVALFASVAAFVDGSAGLMTQRILAPISVDLQVGLTQPLGMEGPSIDALRGQIAKTAGVSAAGTFAAVDIGPGSLRATGDPLLGATTLFAFDPSYLSDFPVVTVTDGSFAANGVLLSVEAASALRLRPGDRFQVEIPAGGRLTLTMTGVADFRSAGILFASRSPDTRGEFRIVPNVVVVDMTVFARDIRPALELDASSRNPVLRTAPVLEVQVRSDRTRYAHAEPSVALTSAEALRRTLERLAPGRAAVLDNVSDSLRAAQGDAVLAKVLFLFLGIPGVLLAAYLAHYAAGLVAESDRREVATLRARGAGPSHINDAIAIESIAVGLVGGAAGLILAGVILTLLFGSPAPPGASGVALASSIGLALIAGIATTALAIFVPRRLSMGRELDVERREIASQARPAWARARLDLALIALAALVETVTLASGGFRPTSAEGQTLSLSFYTLLAPLLLWAGMALLLVRIVRAVLARRTAPSAAFAGLVGGLLRRALARRNAAFIAGVIALSLAVAFGSSLSLFVSTYSQHQRADARLVVGADVRVTPSTRTPRALTDIGGLLVASVSEATAVIEIPDVLVGSDKRGLAAIDPATFARIAAPPDTFFPGSTANAIFAALDRPENVLVSDELARTFNVERGDQVAVRLPRPDGTLVPITFRAVGVFTNFPAFPQGIDLVADRTTVATAIGKTTADFFLLRTADASGETLAGVAERVRAAQASSAFLVQTSQDAYDQDQSTLTALNLGGLSGIEVAFTALMCAAAAAIFVATTLATRRKEYITLRALGVPAGSVYRLVIAEAAALVVAGLAIGLVDGAAMATLSIQILAPLFIVPPQLPDFSIDGLLALVAVVIAGTTIATIAGLTRLAQLRPAEILREE